MMDGEAFWRRLSAADETERRRLLEARRPLPTALFRQLKKIGRRWVERDGQTALRLTAVGLEASEYAEEQDGVAYAWWARGNAFLFLGRYDDALAAYVTAISFFVAQGKEEEVAQLQSNCMLPLIWTGRYAEAMTMGRKALEIISPQGMTPQKANLLLNLGICAAHQGDYRESLTQVTQAAEIFSRLGDRVQMARSLVTRAVALEHLDRFAEAEETLLDALRTLAEQEHRVPWARAALNLGRLHARLTEHWEAIRWLERSRDAFREAGIEVDAAVADLYRARSFLDVGLPTETISLGESIVEVFARSKMSRHVARTAVLLAEAHLRSGHLDRAWQEAERAREILQAQGGTVEVALLDIRRAEMLRRMGRPGAALHLARRAAEVLDVVHHPLRHAEAHLVIAACCEDLGRIEEAQLAYRVAWEAGSHPTPTTEPPPALAYRISYARGVIAEAAGERLLARGEYERAVGYLTHVTQKLGLDELRGGYLTDKRVVYEAALRLAVEDGRLEDAFRYSELGRAGALRDFLSGLRLPGASGNTAGADLRASKAAWAWRIGDVYPISPDDDADPAMRWQERAALERRLAAAYRRHRLEDPRFAFLGHGRIPALDELQSSLPAAAALLSFDRIGERLVAFTVTNERAAVVPLGEVDALRRAVNGVVYAMEEADLFADADDLALLEDEVLGELAYLYRVLLAAPLSLVGERVRHLIVVPGDTLRPLPMEALFDGERHLVERYSISYLPSAGLVKLLPPLGAGGERPLVLACSSNGRLPAAVEEGRRVAELLRGRHGEAPLLLVEGEASGENLRRYSKGVGLMHIVSHGLFRADAPLLSYLHLADGPFTAGDVYDLHLSAALVTLSGCQTGLGQGRGGEVLGLTPAFFFAGASALVASRWQVDDRATASLMQEFYAHLVAGESVADALRAAQLTLRRRYPYPGKWAAFAVWGRGLEAVYGPSASA